MCCYILLSVLLRDSLYFSPERACLQDFDISLDLDSGIEAKIDIKSGFKQSKTFNYNQIHLQLILKPPFSRVRKSTKEIKL